MAVPHSVLHNRRYTITGYDRGENEIYSEDAEYDAHTDNLFEDKLFLVKAKCPRVVRVDISFYYQE